MPLFDILFFAVIASGLLLVPVVLGLWAVRLDRRDRAIAARVRRDRA